MAHKKICKRCLLEKAGEADLAAIAAERISLIPDEEKSSEELYRSRLDTCLACDELNAGICGRCGCFVEIRAARKHSSCPSEKKLWRQ